MSSTKPHFLLFCDGNAPAAGENAAGRGRWRFVLECVETGERTEASDLEPGCAPDRCALIAVLRGLEALEQPSRVTLIASNRYVTRGLQYGLTEWRDNDFSWEHFGAVQPIRNADIWRRIDRALAFHQVQCRFMSPEEPASIERGAKDTRTGVAEQVEPPEAASDIKDEAVISSRVSSRVVATTVAPVASPMPACTPGHSKSIQPAARRENCPRASMPQRVFVDTPLISMANGESCLRQPMASPNLAANEIEPSLTSKQFPEKEIATPVSVHSPLYRVFACLSNLFLARQLKSLCQRVWAAILAIDGWLESFLRCLVLLDPKERHSGR